jgi:hypothetical protein
MEATDFEFKDVTPEEVFKPKTKLPDKQVAWFNDLHAAIESALEPKEDKKDV